MWVAAYVDVGDAVESVCLWRKVSTLARSLEKSQKRLLQNINTSGISDTSKIVASDQRNSDTYASP